MEVSASEFKTILITLKDRNVSLKVKTHTGWSKNYLRIIGFITSSKEGAENSFEGVVLSNTTETEGILINNIATIMAFELEGSCDKLQGQMVYNLVDDLSLKALILD